MTAFIRRACAAALAALAATGTAPAAGDLPFDCYVVEPLSSVKRLPGRVPTDGTKALRLRIIAAKGEYEPASFVLVPTRAVARLELKASALAGPGGGIPAAAVDLKVVKCWYQAGTAWFSYFADPTRRVLVPELLLNDETLIRVDHKTRDNTLRVDGPRGARNVWISYPARAETGKKFNHNLEPVADKATLQPIRLTPGENKQIWVTVHVPKAAAGGLHRGTIAVIANGKRVGELSLALRVLGFELPDPKTYYDLEKDFYGSMYNHCSMAEHVAANGGDWPLAARKLLAEYVNMREHNLLYPLIRGYRHDKAKAFVRKLEVMKAAGLRTRPIFGAVWAGTYGGWKQTDKRLADFRRNADEAFSAVKATLGHTDLYAWGWDEPGYTTVIAQRPYWRYIHAKGGRIFSTGKPWHFSWAGYAEEFMNHGGIMARDETTRWHTVGARVSSYAAPHTGPENPDYMRRAHGLAIYKAGQDGTFNYMYYEHPPNIWNEFGRGSYRAFCMVYPTRTDVIDTLAWEGYREALDDVRYATLLKTLAGRAIAAGDVEKLYAGRKALLYLEELDEAHDDLNTVRLEMIRHILTLRDLLKEGA